KLGSLLVEPLRALAQHGNARRRRRRQCVDKLRLRWLLRRALGDCSIDALDQLGREASSPDLFRHLEVLELGAGFAELSQADLAFGKPGIFRFRHQVVVDVTAYPFLFEPDLERVPISRPIVGTRFLFKDLPGKDIRTIETCEAQLARAG